MNKEELLIACGQRYVSGFDGSAVSDDFKEEVKRSCIGNVILFSRNIVSLEQLDSLCRELDDLITGRTGIHPLIMMDQEGGMVSRLPESAPVIPSQMALSALGSAPLIRKCCYENGRLLKALGCSVNLSPVLDVNENFRNPVIGVRSFSDMSDKVSAFAVAAVKGYKESGIISCGKHFPGHGDTSIDSHLSLPCIDKSLEELEGQLRPFASAIEGGVEGIMTSHILFPKVEEGGIPCTMSRKLIKGLLRTDLGFDGLVLSDCMEMNAIKDYYGTVEGALKALSATVDLVLISHHASLASKAIESTVEHYLAGDFDECEWQCSLERIMRAKKSITPPLPFEEVEEDIPALKAFFDETALRSITIVKGVIPPFRAGSLFIGPEPYITSNISDKLDRVSFPSYMKRAFEQSDAIVTSASPQREEIEDILKRAGEKRLVYFGSYNGHLQRGQLECIKALSHAGHEVVLIALRNPYDIEKSTLASLSAAAVTYEYSLRILAALEEILRGRGRAEGVLPVQLEV